MIWRLALIGMLLFVSVEGYAGDDRWLGYYKGANIPGHEIVESELLTSAFSGLQHEGVYQELLEYMKTQCVRNKGLALVNVSLLPAIGEVKTPLGNSGQSKIVSPGLHIAGTADCVLKINKTTK
jgi:hypothetical protein